MAFDDTLFNEEGLDSVFSSATDAETEFDTMFDQEDSLIDTVNGCNEAGEPLTDTNFDELHQTDDEGVTPKDIEDELEGDENTFGATDSEGTNGYDIEDNSMWNKVGKPSEADEYIGDLENDYQDDDNGPEPDPSNVTDTIDNGIEEFANFADFNSFYLEGDECDGCGPQQYSTGAAADIDAQINDDTTDLSPEGEDGEATGAVGEMWDSIIGAYHEEDEPTDTYEYDDDDDVESEINDGDNECCKEDFGFYYEDADVEDQINSEYESDDVDPDEVFDKGSNTNLDYDYDDETLIDMVSGQN